MTVVLISRRRVIVQASDGRQLALRRRLHAGTGDRGYVRRELGRFFSSPEQAAKAFAVIYLRAADDGLHACPTCGTTDGVRFAEERGGLAGHCDACAA